MAATGARAAFERTLGAREPVKPANSAGLRIDTVVRPSVRRARFTTQLTRAE